MNFKLSKINKLKIFKIFILIIILSIIIILLIIKRYESFTNKKPYLIINNSFEILQKGIINDERLKNIIVERKKYYSIKNNIKNNITNYKIPKIIHFIWIGSIIPDKYISNIETYAINNSSYKIFIWVDKTKNSDIKQLLSNMELHNIEEIQIRNKNAFDKMNVFAGKADILRYEIVYNFGGMYIDVDSKSVKSFDDNFENSFVSIETSGLYNNIQNAQFGFNKKDVFLDMTIYVLGENVKEFIKNNNMDDILSICSPPFFTTCFYYWNDDKIKCINQKYLFEKNEYCYNYHTMDKNW